MARLIDYSAARFTNAMLDSLQIEGVSRYLTWPDTAFNKAKQLLKPEADSLVAGGFTVTPNWEWGKGTWREGRAGGLRDGAEARRQCRALGFPDSVWIPQSVDTDIFAFDYPIAAAYQDGFNESGGCGPQGCYGTSGLLNYLFDRGLIRLGWQTQSRGWQNNSSDNPRAQIIQRGGAIVFGGAIDWNDVMSPYWGAHNACIFGYRCNFLKH
jgi:hypothetical protein